MGLRRRRGGSRVSLSLIWGRVRGTLCTRGSTTPRRSLTRSEGGESPRGTRYLNFLFFFFLKTLFMCPFLFLFLKTLFVPSFVLAETYELEESIPRQTNSSIRLFSLSSNSWSHSFWPENIFLGENSFWPHSLLINLWSRFIKVFYHFWSLRWRDQKR